MNDCNGYGALALATSGSSDPTSLGQGCGLRFSEMPEECLQFPWPMPPRRGFKPRPFKHGKNAKPSARVLTLLRRPAAVRRVP